MFKTAKEYDLAMKEILILIRDEKPIDSLLENDDYKAVFLDCVKSRYVQGVSLWPDANGNYHIDNFKPVITRSGLGFIEQPEY